MSEDIRRFIEDIIKTLSQSQPALSFSLPTPSPSPSPSPSPPPLAGDDDVKGEEVKIEDEKIDETVLQPIIDRLKKLGFGEKDAQRASREAQGRVGISGGSLLDAALDWLCVYLPEHRLPKQFDPRGKQFEVVFNKSRSDVIAHHLGAGRMGIPGRVCESCVKEANDQLEPALWLIYSQLYQALGDTTDFTSTDGIDLTECAQEIEQELVALESIYDTSFIQLSPNSWKIKLEECGELEFLIPPGCAYPHHLPVIILRNHDLSAQQRLHIVQWYVDD